MFWARRPDSPLQQRLLFCRFFGCYTASSSPPPRSASSHPAAAANRFREQSRDFSGRWVGRFFEKHWIMVGGRGSGVGGRGSGVGGRGSGVGGRGSGGGRGRSGGGGGERTRRGARRCNDELVGGCSCGPSRRTGGSHAVRLTRDAQKETLPVSVSDQQPVHSVTNNQQPVP
jgi:hypothetical protein